MSASFVINDPSPTYTLDDSNVSGTHSIQKNVARRKKENPFKKGRTELMVEYLKARFANDATVMEIHDVRKDDIKAIYSKPLPMSQLRTWAKVVYTMSKYERIWQIPANVGVPDVPKTASLEGMKITGVMIKKVLGGWSSNWYNQARTIGKLTDEECSAVVDQYNPDRTPLGMDTAETAVKRFLKAVKEDTQKLEVVGDGVDPKTQPAPQTMEDPSLLAGPSKGV